MHPKCVVPRPGRVVSGVHYALNMSDIRLGVMERQTIFFEGKEPLNTSLSILKGSRYGENTNKSYGVKDLTNRLTDQKTDYKRNTGTRFVKESS